MTDVRKDGKVGEQGWKAFKARQGEYAKEQKRRKYVDRYEHRSDILRTVEEAFGWDIERKATFCDLVDNITGELLVVGGWVEQERIFIEINEACHYTPVRFEGISQEEALENLRDYQRRERIKQQYCLDNECSFVSIPFNVGPDLVEEFLRRYLESMRTVVVGKHFDFAYAHRLHNMGMDAEDNQYIFGKCNNPNGHGHNMGVEVQIKGFVDILTGMVINFVELKRIANEVLDKFDHKFLDLDRSEFEGMVSTSENTIQLLWNQLSIPLPNIHSLKVYETDTSFCEISRAERSQKNG